MNDIIVHNLIVAYRLANEEKLHHSDDPRLARAYAVLATDLEKAISYLSVNIEMTPEVLSGDWKKDLI